MVTSKFKSLFIQESNMTIEAIFIATTIYLVGHPEQSGLYITFILAVMTPVQ